MNRRPAGGEAVAFAEQRARRTVAWEEWPDVERAAWLLSARNRCGQGRHARRCLEQLLPWTHVFLFGALLLSDFAC